MSGILVRFLTDIGASPSLTQLETFSKFKILGAGRTDIRLETLTGEIMTGGQVELTLDKIGHQDFYNHSQYGKSRHTWTQFPRKVQVPS